MTCAAFIKLVSSCMAPLSFWRNTEGSSSCDSADVTCDASARLCGLYPPTRSSTPTTICDGVLATDDGVAEDDTTGGGGVFEQAARSATASTRTGAALRITCVLPVPRRSSASCSHD